MHLDEEQVQRLQHSELEPAVEASLREHLATCPECRTRVVASGRAERAVHALLVNLDHPPPRLDAASLRVRAAARGAARPPWQRWAAAALLAAGFAGAAYAAPGSPVPAWIRNALGSGALRDSVLRVPAPAPPGETGQAGIAVAPGSELVILFAARQTAGEGRVILTEGSQVVIRALTGAATFTSGTDRLVVGNRGSSATFEIQIPRQAPRVEIQVDGVRVFLKVGPETRGPLVFPLTPAGP